MRKDRKSLKLPTNHARVKCTSEKYGISMISIRHTWKNITTTTLRIWIPRMYTKQKQNVFKKIQHINIESFHFVGYGMITRCLTFKKLIEVFFVLSSMKQDDLIKRRIQSSKSNFYEYFHDPTWTHVLCHHKIGCLISSEALSCQCRWNNLNIFWNRYYKNHPLSLISISFLMLVG